MKIEARTASALAAALLLALQVPAPAAAKSWVESPLTASDSLMLLLQLAEGLQGQGKNAGARAALLGAVGPVRDSLPRAHLPATRSQLMKFEKLVPVIYQGFEYKGDMAAWNALMTEHLPKLEALAEKVALPPAGPPFYAPGETFQDMAQRVLRAFSELPEAAKAAGTYAEVAPPPMPHIQQAGTAKITEALRTIMMTALSISEHLKIVDAGCKERGQKAAAGAVEALKVENLLIATDHANGLLRWGEYLLRIDANSAEGKAFEEQGKQTLTKVGEIYDRRVAENRMPKDGYKGDDLAALRAEVKEKASTLFPKLQVLAVTIPGAGFQDEWRWVDLGSDRWSWRWYSNLRHAHVALGKPGEETCRILPLRLERAYQSGRTLGDLYLVQPAFQGGFTMLVANLPAN